jgi:replicative DNA helicase
MISKQTTEESLLFSVLASGDEDVSKGLALQVVSETLEEDFTTPLTRGLFNSLKDCLREELPIEYSYVVARMNTDLHDSFFTRMNTATVINIDALIRSLKQYTTARKLCDSSYSAYTKLKELRGQLNENVELCVQEAEQALSNALVSDIVTSKDEGYIKDFMGQYFVNLKAKIDEPAFSGLPSGIPSIDNLIGGFRAGDVIVVSGRSGMGKSSFISTMFSKQIMMGFKPAIFSFELGRQEVVDKILSQMIKLDGQEVVEFMKIYNPKGKYGTAQLNAKEMKRMQSVAQKYINDNYFFVRGAGRCTVEEVMSKCRKLKAEGNLDAIYVDHIGLLVQDKMREREELTHITNSLKLFASEMQVPIFEVVQLNRGADTTAQKPKLSNLKGSGSIEEDANIVFMPWRPYAIDKENNDPSTSEVIIAKSRNTATGDIPTHFCQATTLFTEIEQREF